MVPNCVCTLYVFTNRIQSSKRGGFSLAGQRGTFIFRQLHKTGCTLSTIPLPFYSVSVLHGDTFWSIQWKSMSSHPARNVLQPTGTTLPLELELEEDIEKEIHHFVQLTRMGHYTDAQKFFDNTLGKHDHLFPVVAEYADMLLEQGRYRHAAEFLNEHIRAKEEIFDPDEMQLLKIMKALAEIYSKGALRSALVEAKRAWSLLDLEGKQRLEDLNEVQAS